MYCAVSYKRILHGHIIRTYNTYFAVSHERILHGTYYRDVFTRDVLYGRIIRILPYHTSVFYTGRIIRTYLSVYGRIIRILPYRTSVFYTGRITRRYFTRDVLNGRIVRNLPYIRT